MKKVYNALIFSLLFMLSIGVNAEAGYVAGENAYTDSASNGAQTVIIYKGTDASSLTPEDVYYVNQSDDAGGFSNLEMLMKLNAPSGRYTVRTDKGSTFFDITNAQAYVSGAETVKFLGVQEKSDGTYSVAFGLRPAVLYAGVSKLAMVIDGDDKAYATNLVGSGSIINWTSGTIYVDDNGYFMFAVQIDGIGADYITNDGGTLTPKFSLFVK